MLFVTEDIMSFINQLDYLEYGSTQCDYRDINPKFHLARNIYNNYYHKFFEVANKAKQKKPTGKKRA